MSEPRIIKKYPNRRLYDTAESRYITLRDVRQLVLEDKPFEVIDKSTKQNITRAVLLQIIAEQEQSGEPVMSRDFLIQSIRAQGHEKPQIVRGYLEQSLRTLLQHLDRTPAPSVVSAPAAEQRASARWQSKQPEPVPAIFEAGTRTNQRRDP